jgi:hypothetical protein
MIGSFSWRAGDAITFVFTAKATVESIDKHARGVRGVEPVCRGTRMNMACFMHRINFYKYAFFLNFDKKQHLFFIYNMIMLNINKNHI